MPCRRTGRRAARLGHDFGHNLATFPVLPGIEGLVSLVGHDRPNPRTGKRTGHEAAYQLIARCTEAGFGPGRDIHVICPSIEGEDVNDLIRKMRRAE